MDIRSLQYFFTICQEGSFTRAAKKLYLSTPGLVKAMDRLEEELQATLFLRGRGGIHLTPAGHMLIRHARPLLKQYEMMCSEVRRTETGRERRVDACMTRGLLNVFPQDFLTRFIHENPKLQLLVHDCSLDEFRGEMSSWRSSIGLCLGECESPDLETIYCHGRELGALMSRSNPLASRGELSLSDFSRERIVILNSDENLTRTLCRRLIDAGGYPQITLEGSTWTNALQLIEQEDYVTFCVPPRFNRHEGLVSREVIDLNLELKLCIVVHKGVDMTEAERSFIDYAINRTEGRT